jgi:exopolyphosphatase / guanosine-5'-triphosphate,3'-diphosphate pyrophosphatase
VHLLAAVVRGHRLQPLVDESVFLGLGAAVEANGELGAPLREALAEQLARYAESARQLNASVITFVGTDPFRRASDAEEAAAQIMAASELPLHIVSPEEEALLTLIGVTSGKPILRETLVVDIGGGSSEFLDVAPGREPVAAGMPLGSARLTRAIVEHDPPTPGELDRLLVEARSIVAGAPTAAPVEVVLVGGTASNLLRVLPESVLDRTLTRRRIASVLAVLATETIDVAAAYHGIRPERARILPAGAAIVAAIMERYGVDRVRVSDAGIREGAVLAAVHAAAAWREGLAWLAHGWTR